ncbi:diacylglycerol kinase, putative [Entamoeba dispar SAW760]|uniref:Diacylglycerol kinase n=1 Tax=Entamoeba dispar (strain ATCC PRA-260 / SAW760) TaxID=370354 RepID=B0EFH2_ENTDS|nr:diacylglycerol kinase, putative [Entamoeba dispar SAW760]EDR26751.1 diacylglycerol kinase, putative [Entamoeba dispar SAW760]|eukprot:EDR26751.1 diacylglycerol kinase, putative [Entamoeba dispar SAW760]
MSVANIEKESCGLTPRDVTNSGLFKEEHDFKEEFSVSSLCVACGQLCLGPSLKCTKCSFVIHKGCKDTFYLKCSGKEDPIDFPEPTFSKKNLKNGQHSFRKVGSTFAYTCSVCHESLISDRFKCSVCNMNVHKKCIKKIKTPCRPISSPQDEKDIHWFVQITKNHVGKSCVVCGETCTSAHFICAWCKLAVDGKCIEKLPSTCFLGRLRKFILPARLVMEKDDWYEALYEEEKEPMIFFINNKSGGHFGSEIFKHAIGLFNPAQVYNVLKGYERPFKFIKNYGSNFVAVICGGDGTVGWVMDELKKVNLKPKIFVIPLGTGNDMSISTGWGGGYNGEDIGTILPQVYDASIQDMDRWQVCVEGQERPIHIFNNYFSIGLDAAIALVFHTKRNANPEKFTSRFTNKLQYIMCSTPMIVSDNKLYKLIHVKVDGRVIELPKIEGLAIINLPTYGGGNKFWPPVSVAEMAFKFHDLHYNDGELELVGFSNAIHLGACVSGTGAAKPIRIAQGKVIEIVIDEDIACQYDGEPYMQSKTTMTISLYEKVRFVVKNLFEVNSI